MGRGTAGAIAANMAVHESSSLCAGVREGTIIAEHYLHTICTERYRPQFGGYSWSNLNAGCSGVARADGICPGLGAETLAALCLQPVARAAKSGLAQNTALSVPPGSTATAAAKSALSRTVTLGRSNSRLCQATAPHRWLELEFDLRRSETGDAIATPRFEC